MLLLALFFIIFVFCRIIEMCDGKGGGKGTRMNAKVNKVNLAKIEELLQSHFKLVES